MQRIAPFRQLPADIICELSSFLPVSSLGALANTSMWIYSDLGRVLPTRHAEFLNRPPSEVDEDGTQTWFDEDGLLHRINGPAVLYANGDELWYYRDLLDRLDGPAVTLYDDAGKIQRQEWRQDGDLHREDGPAVEETIVTWVSYLDDVWEETEHISQLWDRGVPVGRSSDWVAVWD